MEYMNIRTLITCLLVQIVFGTQSIAQWDTLPDRMYADTLQAPFLYGVASGDPTQNSVILWTRIEPLLADSATSVNWQIALDSDMTDLIQSGSQTTSYKTDWTVKVDVQDLQPFIHYYYRFSDAEGKFSVTGRTKTAPDQNTEVPQLNFAVTSCSSIYSGYFNAYARIAERNDLDLWIHLGDYIYDFVDEDEHVRIPYPSPIDPQTKEEFWQRHRYYLLDPDLRAVRQQQPLAALWDNHDLYNKDEANLIGSIEAFFNYLPIRKPDANNTKRIYRTLKYGNLADIFFMDIEVLRNQDTIPGSEEKSLLSNLQYSWLTDELEASKATWHIMANQKLFSNWAVDHVTIPLPFGNGVVADPGAWDGFPAERERLLTFLRDQNINNNIVISGDIHLSIAADLVVSPKDSLEYNTETSEGAIGVEFVPGSISRGNVDEALSTELTDGFLDIVGNLSFNGNPHHEYLELTQHGYGLLQITRDSTAAQFIYSDKLQVTTEDTIFKELIIYEGENHWKNSNHEIVGIDELLNPLFKGVEISDLFPNPVQDVSHFNVLVQEAQTIEIQLLDLQGNQLHALPVIYDVKLKPKQEYPISITTDHLSAGMYLLVVKGANFTYHKKLLKLR